MVHGKSTLSPAELLSDLDVADSVDSSSTSVNSKPTEGPLDDVNSQEALIMTNIEIKCATHEIRIRIPTPHPDFSGMVYPQVSFKVLFVYVYPTAHVTCSGINHFKFSLLPNPL